MPVPKKYFSPESIEKTKKRILDSVEVQPDGCWIWKKKKNHKKGADTQKEYGLVWFATKRRLAHRVSKAIFHDRHYILDHRDILCCHKCDNPSCVNPEHIFLGTASDNSKDMVSKGRAAKIYQLICPHCNKDL